MDENSTMATKPVTCNMSLTSAEGVAGISWLSAMPTRNTQQNNARQNFSVELHYQHHCNQVIMAIRTQLAVNIYVTNSLLNI